MLYLLSLFAYSLSIGLNLDKINKNFFESYDSFEISLGELQGRKSYFGKVMH